jgi:hypothetical protein
MVNSRLVNGCLMNSRLMNGCLVNGGLFPGYGLFLGHGLLVALPTEKLAYCANSLC